MQSTPLSASSPSASAAATQASPRDAAGARPVFYQPQRMTTMAARAAFEAAYTPGRLREALDAPGMRFTLNNMSKRDLEQVVMAMAENFGQRTHVILEQLQAAVPRRANDINEIRLGDVYQNYFS